MLDGLTSQLEMVDGLLAHLGLMGVAATTPTASTIALDVAGDLLQSGLASGHRPLIVWLTDEPPTIDRLGRGPYTPEKQPLDLSLLDGQGLFLPWGRVAWLGPFKGSYTAFAGEPLANAMQGVEQLKLQMPTLRIHGLLLQGDGATNPLVRPDLLAYAAAFSEGSHHSAANTADLLLAVGQVGNSFACQP